MSDLKTTIRAESTGKVEHPEDLQRLFDEVSEEVLNGSELPNAMTLTIEWES